VTAWLLCPVAAPAAVRSAQHGPDPAAIDALAEPPAPTGGPRGRPLLGSARLTATAADVAGSLPESWCGPARATDDTDSETLPGERKIHAVYAVAADATDRLAALGGRLQADAFRASALLEELYGRALRFDMGTDCGPQYIDITTLRLTPSSAELAAAAAGDTLIETLRGPLRAAGFAVADETDRLSLARQRRMNYLVWLDGAPVEGSCGQATLYPDTTSSPDANINAFGGKIAVVFRDGQGFCGSNTVRHEIGHTLGALMPAAPHAFDGSHCDDAYEDTMCYPSAPHRDSGSFQARFFDYGNDDYWALPGTDLGRWTIDRSPFVCPDVSCNVPGGARASGLDADGDLLPDVLDLCPGADDLAALDPTGRPGCEDHPDGAPQGQTTTARTAERSRNVVVRIRRHGRYRITVTCRGRRVGRRQVRGPRKVVLKVRCGARPRAKLRRLR
jgi:hypothetical protein